MKRFVELLSGVLSRTRSRVEVFSRILVWVSPESQVDKSLLTPTLKLRSLAAELFVTVRVRYFWLSISVQEMEGRP